MAPSTLAERFQDARAAVVEVDGAPVHSVFALPVAGRTTLRITREAATPLRPQTLRLAAAVPLEANGRRATDLALRSTTAPEVVDVVVDAVDDTVVYLWNTWTTDGIEHAWLGNAGMRIEADLTGAEPVVRVACSDGVGPATFDDLVVAVALLPSAGTVEVGVTATGHARR
jgi:hypothetical protein